jgi:GNAT superfamily N-acetyltransferase
MSTAVALKIVAATPGLATALSEVAQRSKATWGYPTRWMVLWRPVLTITPQFIAEHPVFVAMEAGTIVGFYALGIDGSSGSLEHLWVLPQAIGQGVGRALWHHALEELARQGVKTLEIIADPNAEGFYLRMGARRVGTKRYLLEGRARLLPLLAMDIDTA